MGFGKDGKGAILRETQSITLATLASGVALKSASQLVIEEDFRIIKTEFIIRNIGAKPDVPVVIGIANNKFTVAEIAEAINADGPLDRNEEVVAAKAERAVWLLYVIDAADALLPTVGGEIRIPLEKVLRWTFQNDDGWTWFAYNMSGDPCTTGAVISIIAKHFGVWVT